MTRRHKFEAGQRIRLVRTQDRFTDLKPGATGTVVSYDPYGDLGGGAILDVDWDSGSKLALLLDEGDAAELIGDAETEGSR